MARPFTIVCLKLTSSGRPVGQPTWHKNTSAYHSLGNCISLQTRLVQKPPPQLFRDLLIITPVTVFSCGHLSYQIIYNALRDYTCIKTNSGALVAYSASLLVSCSQTDLRTSRLLIVPIISETIDKRVVHNFSHNHNHNQSSL